MILYLKNFFQTNKFWFRYSVFIEYTTYYHEQVYEIEKYSRLINQEKRIQQNKYILIASFKVNKLTNYHTTGIIFPYNIH